MKKFILFNLFVSATMALAYPVVDRIVETGGEPIKVYPDNFRSNIYWYIPVSIEPWQRDNTYRSAISYRPGRSLAFVFRGQASVEEDMLKRVAKALKTDVANLTPIAYEESDNMLCQNFYVGKSIQWLFPKRIGNYLEVVPVSIRSDDAGIVDELYDLITHGGLACTVDVKFKAVSTAYLLKLSADMNSVYERFEAGAHAGGLWWEIDIHTMIQSLYREGIIHIEKLEDVNAPKTTLDTQVEAAWGEIAKQIIAILFKPVLKLPEGGFASSGKPWNLRVDYVKSTERSHYALDLDSRNVSAKQTQISLRLATE